MGGYLASTEPAADGGPPVSGATIADAAGGGMQAALAVMAALIGRGEDGPGVHLDVSIADGVLWLTSLAVDEYLATGAPVGFGHDVITGRYACYDTYRCADGRWLAVGAIEPKFFANLCRLLGCAQWAGQPAVTTRCRTPSGPTSPPRSPPATATPGWPNWLRPTPA